MKLSLPRFVQAWLVAVALLAFAPSTLLAKMLTDRELVLSSQSFLDAHPDIKNREIGMRARKDGDDARALEHFRRASRFADKPSQSMMAVMLWTGEGIAKDRAQAYAWMDLAAERGYRSMLAQREAYWEALTPAEREAAVAFGETLYAEFGDAVAQPRLEAKLRQAMKKSAGSRTGYLSGLKIAVDTPTGKYNIDGASYYDPDFWEPKHYWAWQERNWNEPGSGKVRVGPMSSAQADEPR